MTKVPSYNPIVYVLIAYGLLSICCVFSGCKGSLSSGSGSFVTVNLDESASNERFPAIEELKVVKLETSDMSLLSSVTKMEIVDSLIVIMSGKLLSLFDLDGNYLATVGRQGRGPEEYVNMSAFYVDPLNKEIVIVDNIANRLLRHDYGGNYIGSTELPENSMDWGYYVRPVGDGKLLVANEINPVDHNAYTLLSISDKSAEKMCPVSIAIKKGARYFANAPIAGRGAEARFILPFDDRVYAYSNSGIDTLCLINTGQPVAPEKVLGSIVDYNLASSVEVADKGYFPGFGGIFETNSFLFLNYLKNGKVPAFCMVEKSYKKGAAYTYNTDFANSDIPFLPITGCYEDYLVAPVSANILKSLADVMPADSPYYTQFRGIADKSGTEDNDCLIFYKLRLDF